MMRAHVRTVAGQRQALLFVALLALIVLVHVVGGLGAGLQPAESRRGMVVSQEAHATRVGLDVLRDGGNAVDAAVATALALAVTHPAAGNLGGGGFLLFRSASGEAAAYDFREVAPVAATAEMFIVDGVYDRGLHHDSHVAVGVPGTVAGLHLAWSDEGVLPWGRLVQPAITLAEDGFAIPPHLATSLAGVLGQMAGYPASVAQFSKDGVAYQAGERLHQPDLARTLERIAKQGPDGFYQGRTAELIETEMQAHGGLITQEDLASYRPLKRVPVTGTYRGYGVISMPPSSSGGVALLQMLNILEGYDLANSGFGSATTMHLMTEAMRRAYADRARYLGDPASNRSMPVDQLISKPYAERQRASIRLDRASTSSPSSFEWAAEGEETTHLSVVDGERNAVSLTYTLERGYGSKIVVPGAGFLLNNEMGDFNAGPGLTDVDGLIGTMPNLAGPGKRMLSSMTPTIVTRDGRVVMVTGSPGGRTIINTLLETIVNVVDFRMSMQEAVDAPRFHHQWLPDQITVERGGFSAETLALLRRMGHQVTARERQGSAQVIGVDPESSVLVGAPDRRASGSTALGH